MAKRKTIEVEFIKDKVNAYLECGYLSNAEKKGLRMILEDVLHKADNYQGFRYLDSIEGMTVRETLEENRRRYF